MFLESDRFAEANQLYDEEDLVRNFKTETVPKEARTHFMPLFSERVSEYYLAPTSEVYESTVNNENFE